MKGGCPGREDETFRDPGEKKALEWLQSRGHLPLRHNVHFRSIEVDLVTWEPAEGILHFIEVKDWKPGPIHPTEVYYKKRRYGKATEWFLLLCENELARAGIVAPFLSCDLLVIQGDAFDFFENIS